MVRPLSGDRTHSCGAGGNIPKSLLKDVYFSRLYGLAVHLPSQIDVRSRFATHLALLLPEAAKRIEYGDLGILHLEVGALKLASRDAIARNDWKSVGQHFDFADEIMKNADAELLDALHISYLGGLFYGEITENFTKARSLLPKRLFNALAEVERHYREITASPG